MVILLHPLLVFPQSSPDSSLVVFDSIRSIEANNNEVNDSTLLIENDSLILLKDTIRAYQDTMHIHTHDSVSANKEMALLGLSTRKDSLDVYSYSLSTDSINYKVFHYIDTSNHNSGEYNPVKYFGVSYNDLGVIGSAQENQIFSPVTQTGFAVGFNNYNAFLRKPADILLYDTRTPYSNLLYVMGKDREHSLMVAHAQSFLDQQVTLRFDFQLFNNLGSYSYQKTDARSFYGGLGYKTKDSRYNANVEYYHNKQVLQENGGLADLNDFENNLENNRQVFTTNLKTGENFVRISGVEIDQSFYLSKPEPDLSKIPDTNIIQFEGYSVTHFKKPYFDPVSHLGQIKYYFNFENNSFKYTDKNQNSKIYDSIPYYPTSDSTVFFDSIGMRKYQNEIIYSNSDYKDNADQPKFLNYFFGGRHEYNEYYQDSVKQYFTHYAIIGGVFINLSTYLSILSDVEYYVGDYLNNDFSFNGKVFFKLKAHFFTGGIKISHRSQDWIFQSFSTSRFTWENNFNKSDVQRLYLKYQLNSLDVFIQVQNISQLVYFNEQIIPEQSSDNIQHVLIQVQKGFHIGPWGTDLRISYQSVTHPNTIRVPEFAGKIKLFYQNLLFNNALGLEIGVEASYFTKYYANKYMPAMRSFHIQNDQEIGDYPYMDVYLNAKIGRARLFVRYDHFNAGMMGYTYYASPDYPAQDAAFRFGVRWILFN